MAVGLMPLDPKIEARPPTRRHLSGRKMIWLLFIRLASTSWMLFAGINIAQSNAAWWAKAACVIPFAVFIHAFAKDNVSDPG
jgi:hypothetical protein